MGRTIPAALSAHINQETTTLATCWKLTRKDATVLRFTDHDRDLVVGGDTYKSPQGYSSTSIRNSSDMSVDHLEVVGIIDAADITESDLIAGLYDDAQVEMFMVNWADTAQGQIDLRKGWIGEITTKDGIFIAELRGLTVRLHQEIGELYSPMCRADFADARCGINGALFTTASTVTGVTSTSVFRDTGIVTGPTTVFAHGLLTFTSGLNSGLAREVKVFNITTKDYTVYEPFPFTIQIGDAYTIVEGCDKSLTTCINKYSNVTNFRGEPYLPGSDRVIQYIIRA